MTDQWHTMGGTGGDGAPVSVAGGSIPAATPPAAAVGMLYIVILLVAEAVGHLLDAAAISTCVSPNVLRVLASRV